MPQAEEEDEKGTAGGLLSSLEGPKMRPSLLMTRYLESWGAAKPFAHLSHLESPVSTSTPLPVSAPPSEPKYLITPPSPPLPTSLSSPPVSHLMTSRGPELSGCPSPWFRPFLALPSKERAKITAL